MLFLSDPETANPFSTPQGSTLDGFRTLFQDAGSLALEFKRLDVESKRQSAKLQSDISKVRDVEPLSQGSRNNAPGIVASLDGKTIAIAGIATAVGLYGLQKVF